MDIVPATTAPAATSLHWTDSAMGPGQQRAAPGIHEFHIQGNLQFRWRAE